MVKPKRIILKITPQTNIRATQGDRIFFRIRRDKLRPEGLKRLLRLERYNKYKIDILSLSKEKNFTFPEQGLEINFFIPIPKSWKEYKKKAMHLKLHQQKPDLSNLLKALEDGLLSEDKGIAHYAGVSKRWINKPEGYIELVIHPPKIKSNDNLM